MSSKSAGTKPQNVAGIRDLLKVPATKEQIGGGEGGAAPERGEGGIHSLSPDRTIKYLISLLCRTLHIALSSFHVYYVQH